MSFESDNPRRLLVFAAADVLVTRQRESLSGYEAGIRDRDLRVEYLTGATETRKRYGVVAGEFAAILIGRDGGEKLRASEPVPTPELFNKIDEMPMRRRELREQRESE